MLPTGCSLDDNRVLPLSSCSLDVCTCDLSLLANGSVCCCRPTQQEPVQGIQCNMSMMVPELINVTSCGCTGCDDIRIIIDITVVAMRTLDPIPAARVYLVNGTSANDLFFIGITNNFGQFRFRESVSARTVVLMVQAAGYLVRTSNPFNLQPSISRVSQQVVLMPSMEVAVGVGGSTLNVRLGSMLAVTAPPNSFMTADGEFYEGQVIFRGNVVEVGDEAALSMLPSTDFVYTDPTTGQLVRFGMIVGLQLTFEDSSQMRLTIVRDLDISVSITGGGGNLQPSIVTYDPLTGKFSKAADLTAVQPLRRKRQQPTSPIVYIGTGTFPGMYVTTYILYLL